MFELFPMLLPVGVRPGQVPDVARHSVNEFLDVALKVENNTFNQQLHLAWILPEICSTVDCSLACRLISVFRHQYRKVWCEAKR